jgi:hypothetical protein
MKLNSLTVVRIATAAASATTAVARRAIATTSRAVAWLLQQITVSDVVASGQVKIEPVLFQFLMDVTRLRQRMGSTFVFKLKFLHPTHSTCPFLKKLFVTQLVNKFPVYYGTLNSCQSEWCYNPKDSHLHTHYHENLKFYLTQTCITVFTTSNYTHHCCQWHNSSLTSCLFKIHFDTNLPSTGRSPS